MPPRRKPKKAQGKAERPNLSGPAKRAVGALHNEDIVFRTAASATEFAGNLLSLLRDDEAFGLQLLTVENGAQVFERCLLADRGAHFWADAIEPLCECLLADKFGVVRELAASVVAAMASTPLFLQTMCKLVEQHCFPHDVAFAFVDNLGVGYKDDEEVCAVLRAVLPHMNDTQRRNVAVKYNLDDGTAVANASTSTAYADMSLQTMRELAFERHDNDAESIADIFVLPTTDELQCEGKPFLGVPGVRATSMAELFSTNFRLLREDMLSSMRFSLSLLDVGSAAAKEKQNAKLLKRLRAFTLDDVEIEDVVVDTHNGAGVSVSFAHPRPNAGNATNKKAESIQDQKKRLQQYWSKNSKFLKRNSLCAIVDATSGGLQCFGTVLDGNNYKKPLDVDVETLRCSVVLSFEDVDAIVRISKGGHWKMVQLPVSHFAYEPVLSRLQDLTTIDHSLARLIVNAGDTVHDGDDSEDSEVYAGGFERLHSASLLANEPRLRALVAQLQDLTRRSKPISAAIGVCKSANMVLDDTQMRAVVQAMSAPVGLIQGPPGTGKSLCGALVGSLLHSCTDLTVMCLCYTNHALDQFLCDLFDLGVPVDVVARLGGGSKSDDERVSEALLAKKNTGNAQLKRLKYNTYKDLEDAQAQLRSAWIRAQNFNKWGTARQSFEDHEDEDLFWEAFGDGHSDGFEVKGGSPAQQWKRWLAGKPSAIAEVSGSALWAMNATERLEKYEEWTAAVRGDLQDKVERVNDVTETLRCLHDEGNSMYLNGNCRIIGCTTTGAAMFAKLLDGVRVDVLLVEEAGEILEAHVLAALSARSRHVIMIGDHKQLRPKVESYELTELGSRGRVKLDVSMFERLVLGGAQHTTLEEQHRMSTSIAAFAKSLTYPNLRTASHVQRRALFGSTPSVQFLSHRVGETESQGLHQISDQNSLSKYNEHEVLWVGGIVRHLLHQREYAADDIVVLTPYLAQLLMIRKELARAGSAVQVQVSDRDQAELVAAGESADAVQSKGVRVATIDNYQGEEANIVIASLVRSKCGDSIGFLADDKRVNVLLTRAREAMIFIGNDETLCGARRGGALWRSVIDLFKQNGSVSATFTTVCTNHPDRNTALAEPADFARLVPYGGCDMPCSYTYPSCKHRCARKCHSGACPKQCSKCIEERKKREAARRAQLQLQAKRDKLAAQVAAEQAKLDERKAALALAQEDVASKLQMKKIELEAEYLSKKNALMEKESLDALNTGLNRLKQAHTKRMKALEKQSAKEIAVADSKEAAELERSRAPAEGASPSAARSTAANAKSRSTASKQTATKGSPTSKGGGSGRKKAAANAKSAEQEAWEAMRVELQSWQCSAMDELFAMTGLREVKKIALSMFQTALNNERLRLGCREESIIRKALNFTFVGNPGTGKTCTARIFARLVKESGARSSDNFVELSAVEALRLGDKEFAAKIDELCGKDEDDKAAKEKTEEKAREKATVGPFGRENANIMDASAPLPTAPGRFRVNQKVLIDMNVSAPANNTPYMQRGVRGRNYFNQVGQPQLYPAVIQGESFQKAFDDKSVSYDVTFANGETEQNVPISRIQVHTSASSTAKKKAEEAKKSSGKARGGVLFIDEAYDLQPLSNAVGASIVQTIMKAAEDHRDCLTVILAGYERDIDEKIMAYNVGMNSRFQKVHFADFEQFELAKIWTSMCTQKMYACSEDVTEIAAKRLARGRGTRGFGNARAVRTLFEKAALSASATPCAATMIGIEEKHVIGEDPTANPRVDRILEELDGMIGLSGVKADLRGIVSLARKNYARERDGADVIPLLLNRVFVGNPGTGKSTIAALYGRLLKELSLLSNGEVVAKVASDLMGDVVGASQQRTKAIVEGARGKVLLIDEAYGLNDQMYGKQALDCIVERVSGAPGEDIAVVMIGYEEEMRDMIRQQNPGLQRRFDLKQCMLKFDDFSDEELDKLFKLYCRKSAGEPSAEVCAFATRLLAKQRNSSNFGNAGSVRSLVNAAAKRLIERNGDELCETDLDPDYCADADPLAALSDLQDTPIKVRIDKLHKQLQVRRAENRTTENLVGNFIFTGNPGTGKTTVARKLATCLYAIGLLARDHVEETSGPELQGQYVGQTGKIVEEKIKSAKGGVLFIDEAYDLARSTYGEEAINQLLTYLTRPDYATGKTVFVLAGYTADMHRMLETNVGLKSRFQEFVDFPDIAPAECVLISRKILEKEKPFQLEASTSVDGYVRDLFSKLQQRPGWANYRDIIQFCKKVESARDDRVGCDLRVARSAGEKVYTFADVHSAGEQLLRSRPAAASAAASDAREAYSEPTRTQSRTRTAAPSAVKTAAASAEATEATEEEAEEVAAESDNPYDIMEHSDLISLNSVLEDLYGRVNEEGKTVVSGESAQKLLDGDVDVTHAVTAALASKPGISTARKTFIISQWRIARNKVEDKRKKDEEDARKRIKLEKDRKLREALAKRKPIIQCQVCKATANYWCPCPVAPKQIGWDPPGL